MKAPSFLIATGLATVMLLSTIAPVGIAPSDSSNGIGFQGDKLMHVNIIGRPNEHTGDEDNNSNGHRVFISLTPPKKADGSTDAPSCDGTNGVDDSIDESTGVPEQSYPDHRERLHFEVTGSWEVIDGDATDDGEAIIGVEQDFWNTNEDSTIRDAKVDVYVRALGKPGGCFEAVGYAYDDATGDNYYQTGTLDVQRKSGAPETVKINEIFEVYACFDTNGDGVYEEDCGTYSVFDSRFEDYFWSMSNNGLKLLQLIFVQA